MTVPLGLSATYPLFTVFLQKKGSSRLQTSSSLEHDLRGELDVVRQIVQARDLAEIRAGRSWLKAFRNSTFSRAHASAERHPLDERDVHRMANMMSTPPCA
jgi:hypothetical protein